MAGMQTYAGGCHCGAVRYEAQAAIESAMACNCSLCRQRGWLLGFTSADHFRLKSGQDSLTEYRFNTRALSHLFCKTCGIAPFSRGPNPKTGGETVALNLRCIDGLDAEALPVRRVDGASL
jgi:hypothetical protein